MKYFEHLIQAKSCVSTWDFVIKDVSFDLSVAVVGILTECYPSRRYRLVLFLVFLPLYNKKN